MYETLFTKASCAKHGLGKGLLRRHECQVNYILKVRQLDHLSDKVFTNLASLVPDGTLLIQPSHQQEDCKLLTKNLRKGQIMEDYLKSCGRTFSNIVTFVMGRLISVLH